MMPGLVLELKQDELIIINGAAIRFRTKSRIEISSKARFLFGKQIIPAEEAITPARRIYVALQTAYVGDVEARPGALAEANGLIALYRAATASPMAHTVLDQILVHLQGEDFYKALKLTRHVIRHEDAARQESGSSSFL